MELVGVVEEEGDVVVEAGDALGKKRVQTGKRKVWQIFGACSCLVTYPKNPK